MGQADAYQKIKESLDVIFAYALKRTDNRQEAEDLSQEIAFALWQSAPSIRDMDRFYGWMWAVADNVFKAYLRKRKTHDEVDYHDYLHTPSQDNPQTKLEDKEDVGLLYRELSLLSGLYRQCMSLYYLRGHSCKEIAQTLDISQEMVKQYLFKSRRKVKEGMSIIRERGQRSFDPGKFNIYFWGKGSNYCVELFRRRLPGNIMLESYYRPVTLEQLSTELGVATVYLEDEIDILLKQGLLLITADNRVQANIVIFTGEFEQELLGKISQIYAESARWLGEHLRSQLPAVRDTGIEATINDNALMWQLAVITLQQAVIEKYLGQLVKRYPSLDDKNQGYRWGLERSYGDNNFDLGINRHSAANGDTIHLVDFAIFGQQHGRLCQPETAELLFSAVRKQQLSDTQLEDLAKMVQDGYMVNGMSAPKPAFPVYSNHQYQAIKQLVDSAAARLAADCRNLVPQTEELLANYVPDHLKEQVPVMAALKQVEGYFVNIMNELYLNNFIEIPKPCHQLLTAYIVMGDEKGK